MKKSIAVCLVCSGALLSSVANAAPLKLTLTFDDGTKDHIEVVSPMLAKYGWKGTFNIVTGSVGKPNHLTWDDIRTLSKQGHEIASHTITHPGLVQLLARGNTNEVRRQYRESRAAILRETGRAPQFMCHPGMAGNEATDALCREEGMLPMTLWRHNFGHGTKARTPSGIGAKIDAWLAEGRTRQDVLIHGVKPGGGWYPFDSEADFAAFLEEIRDRERCGLVKVVSYAEYYACTNAAASVSGAPKRLELSICDYGAATNAAPAANAAAIQKAIDAVAAAGGGCVVVPKGEWVSGTIWLKSNVELFLAWGAVLKASPNFADYNREDAYPENWGCPKSEYWRGLHFIICRCARNVAITGAGTIHGNGDVFFDEKPIRYFDWMTPTAYCWWNGIRWSKDKVNLRPGQLVVFIKSQHLRVEGITIRNAPCWSMFFHGCEDVTVRNYTVRNGHDDGNTDGIDIDCCRNVLLEDLDIDTGDDAVTVRGSGAALKLDPEPPCENVVVRRAKLKATSSVFRIGVGAGLIRNVTIEDIESKRGGTAINLNACYGDHAKGGVDMENIVFRRCRFENCRETYNIWAAGKKQTFGIRNVIFEDVTFPTNMPHRCGAASGNPVPKNVIFNYPKEK